MWIAIAGVVLIAVGVVLIFLRRSQQRQLGAIESTQTSQVQLLKELAQSMTGEMGQGSFIYLTEVKGKIACQSPLRSELGQVECVYYSMRVTRQYEETYYETDAQNKRVRRTRTGSETVAENARSVPFMIDDGTGQIQVEPEGAEFVAEKVLSRFEAGGGQTTGELRMGGFALRLPAMGGDQRTLGYRFEEEAIPVGRNIYVLGEATELNGELRLHRPRQGEFIVSLKGEEELVRQKQTAAKWLLAGIIVCLLAGVGLLAAAAVTGSGQ